MDIILIILQLIINLLFILWITLVERQVRRLKIELTLLVIACVNSVPKMKQAYEKFKKEDGKNNARTRK